MNCNIKNPEFFSPIRGIFLTYYGIFLTYSPRKPLLVRSGEKCIIFLLEFYYSQNCFTPKTDEKGMKEKVHLYQWKSNLEFFKASASWNTTHIKALTRHNARTPKKVEIAAGCVVCLISLRIQCLNLCRAKADKAAENDALKFGSLQQDRGG